MRSVISRKKMMGLVQYSDDEGEDGDTSTTTTTNTTTTTTNTDTAINTNADTNANVNTNTTYSKVTIHLPSEKQPEEEENYVNLALLKPKIIPQKKTEKENSDDEYDENNPGKDNREVSQNVPERPKEKVEDEGEEGEEGEEDYINSALLHGEKRKDLPTEKNKEQPQQEDRDSSDEDRGKRPNTKKPRMAYTHNALIPTARKAGRYISKKEKEEAVAEATQKEAAAREAYLRSQNSDSSESFMEIPPRLNSILKHPESEAKKGLIPRRLSMNFLGHTKGVNCVRWSRPYGQLLASASNDHTVRIWDVFRSKECVRVLSSHSESVKEVQWNADGRQVITASYDKTVKLHDVETGVSIQTFKHKEFVTALAYHPYQHDIFLSGGARSGIACWDSRSNSVIQTYHGMFGQVQSLEFLHNGKQFASSSDITKRNSTDKGIIIWEFDTSIVVSNQVYVETFTCPVIREHPKKRHFVAQSNGNYIAIFKTDYPYKLNRAKRFEGHHVAGYHIGCSFSPSGDVVVSGSADGSVYFYDWNSCRILKIIQAHTVVCMDAVYHPLVSSMVATCSWDNRVSVFE